MGRTIKLPFFASVHRPTRLELSVSVRVVGNPEVIRTSGSPVVHGIPSLLRISVPWMLPFMLHVSRCKTGREHVFAEQLCKGDATLNRQARVFP